MSPTLPPTPPLRPDNGFDGTYQSPSTTSAHSSATAATTAAVTAAAPYYGTAISNTDPQLQRQPLPPTSHPGPSSLPSASQSPYQNSPYPPSPNATTTYSYPSPAHPAVAPPAMYYQRPLPTTFPPPLSTAPVPMDPALSNSPQASPIDQGSPWQHQHHHYISPSSSAAFAGQSQDRYVCQTCNKAFSRPSSLRIHSHSHTGEKPFKCPHPGCGKAFSVRSNMKRHERGCHGGGSPGST